MSISRTGSVVRTGPPPGIPSHVPSAPAFDDDRGRALWSIESIKDRYYDLRDCEQISAFLGKQPLGAEAFEAICTFLDERGFTLEQAMDIAKEIQAKDSTFEIVLRVDLHSTLAMFADRIAVFDEAALRDLIFTTEIFDDAYENEIKSLVKFVERHPSCKMTKLHVGKTDDADPDPEESAAWKELACIAMGVKALKTLECPTDWIGLSKVTSVHTLALEGGYPRNGVLKQD